jgi:hypothetical protein
MLVLRQNPDADLPGCNANDEGENDRGLTAADTKTRSLNQAHSLSDRVPANTVDLHQQRDFFES